MLLVSAVDRVRGRGDVWVGVRRVGKRGAEVTKPMVLARRGLFRLHHRQLRSPSITTKLQLPTSPIHLRLYDHSISNMSLTYGMGGATAALGVVALCMCSAQGRQRWHS